MKFRYTFIYTCVFLNIWAIATVCFVFIFLGIFVEHLIDLAGHWLKKHRKAAIYEAIEKLKTVLMQLGLMSLILTVTQGYISNICITNEAADFMLPCRDPSETKTTHHDLLFTNLYKSQFQPHHQRILLADSPSNPSDYCESKGKTSLMSVEGMNQLNIFIFVLAAMQIVYSLATMGLGRAKMKRWKSWEKETQTIDYMIANDPKRFRYTRETTFGRRHMSSFATNSAFLWIKCFFRQFFKSVAKVDYFTLRHGFISAHLPANNSFNFRKYIQRSLEDDFKTVVGINPIMWMVVVIFLLVDVHGWNVYLWVSFLPLLIVLFVGTKLEIIVARMAMQLANNNAVIKGTPLVQPDNNLFWFKRPQLVLTLLHFILFMNAFELSFFIWVTWQFGIKSCYQEQVASYVIRIVLAVMVQVLCSYITLPLYALVTKMGSNYKSAILEEHTIHALKQRHTNVKHKRKINNQLHHSSPDDSTSTAVIRLSNSGTTDASTMVIQLSNSGTTDTSTMVIQLSNSGTTDASTAVIRQSNSGTTDASTAVIQQSNSGTTDASTAVIRLSNNGKTDASTSHQPLEFVSSDEDEIVEIQTQNANTSQIQNQHELD
ncbi:MLO-like protein 3 [Salvia divinorum]|uniref:MLO-like protein n=1 Tax=Salvia divinorum TaxID=28513 RepID=A0ABD1HQ13_SALDI